jgi:phage baseplate assembly protein gpV
VDSIDREARIAKVRIPGLTDGATDLPEAQFCNPLGDKSYHTEIRVKPGDDVWLAFERGDTRYPVIVGYRPRNEENGIDWRRFEHANFQFTADEGFVIDAGVKVTINAPKVEVNASNQATVTSPKVLVDSPDSHFTGAVTVDGLITYNAGLEGSGSVKNNGKDIGSTHMHDKTKPGNPGEKSGPPA